MYDLMRGTQTRYYETRGLPHCCGVVKAAIKAASRFCVVFLPLAALVLRSEPSPGPALGCPWARGRKCIRIDDLAIARFITAAAARPSTRTRAQAERLSAYMPQGVAADAIEISRCGGG